MKRYERKNQEPLEDHRLGSRAIVDKLAYGDCKEKKSVLYKTINFFNWSLDLWLLIFGVVVVILSTDRLADALGVLLIIVALL